MQFPEILSVHFNFSFSFSVKALTVSDITNLRKQCKQNYPKCAGYPGTLTVIYAEDAQQRNVILFVVSSMELQKRCKGKRFKISFL